MWAGQAQTFPAAWDQRKDAKTQRRKGGLAKILLVAKERKEHS
jgi:hypothetical protein